MTIVLPYLFLLTLLSNNVFGGGYIPQDEALIDKQHTVYTRKAFCEKTTGKTCIEVIADYNPTYVNLVDNIVNDYSKPIIEKLEVEACSGNCEELVGDKFCSDITAMPKHDETSVYCEKVTGYETKIDGKKMVYDEAKKQAHDDAKAAKKALEDKIEAVARKMEKGKKAIAYFRVLNSDKNLTVAQKNQMRNDSDIKAIRELLQDGDIDNAKAVIQGYGVNALITQDDKDKLINFLSE